MATCGVGLSVRRSSGGETARQGPGPGPSGLLLSHAGWWGGTASTCPQFSSCSAVWVGGAALPREGPAGHC